AAGQAVLDGPEDGAEIKAVDQDAGRHGRHDADGATWPRDLRGERDAGEDQPRDGKTPDEEGEGLGMPGDQPRGDETGRPEEDEGGRDQALARKAGHIA